MLNAGPGKSMKERGPILLDFQENISEFAISSLQFFQIPFLLLVDVPLDAFCFPRWCSRPVERQQIWGFSR